MAANHVLGRVLDAKEGDNVQVHVQQLFVHESISRMRETEAAARLELQKKRQELRSLVGTRYRDLIDSADSIVEMKRCGEELGVHVSNIEDAAQRLLARLPNYVRVSSEAQRGGGTDQSAQGGSEAESAAREEEKKKLRRRFELAQNIKVLVDTPEKIWIALEQDDFLCASELYFRALNIHRSLRTDPSSKSLVQSIPLLGRQWDAISQFPSLIRKDGRATLFSTTHPVLDYARILHALSLVDDLGPVELLRELLNARTHALEALLKEGQEMERASGGDEKATGECSAEQRLCTAIDILQLTLHHVLDTFVTPLRASTGAYIDAGERDEDNLCLLDVIAKRHRTTELESLPAPAVLRRGSEQATAQSHGSPLSSADVQGECRTWLVGCCDILARDGVALLSGVDSVADLAALEKSAWARQCDNEARVGAHARPDSSVQSRWAHVCYVTLGDTRVAGPKDGTTADTGGAFDAWESVFSGIVKQKVKMLLQKRFASIDLQTRVAAAVEHVSSSREALDVGYLSWECKTVDHAEGLGSTATDIQQATQRFIRSCAYGLPSEIETIVDTMDRELSDILDDVKPCLVDPSSRALRMIGQSPRRLGRGMAGATSTRARDARDISVALQEECSQFVAGTLGRCEELVGEMYQRSICGALCEGRVDEIDGEIVAKCVFVGRLARALTHSSASIEHIFPSDQEATEGTRSRLSRLGGGLRMAKENARLRALRLRSRRCFLSAHAVWSLVHSTRLHGELRADLDEVKWESPEAVQECWQHADVVVSGDSGDTTEKILLPMQPSPFVSTLLFSACAMVQEAGAHTTETIALKFFASQLLRGITEALLSVVDGGADGSRITPVDVCHQARIQLLFDTHFVKCVLSVGDVDTSGNEGDGGGALMESVLTHLRGLTSSSGVQTSDNELPLLHWLSMDTAEMEERIRRVVSVLEKEIDPIDLAFFKPLLQSHTQRCYLRSTAFLGFFTSIDPQFADAKLRTSLNEAHQLINVSPSVARIPLLPISSHSRLKAH
eukprot:TRINITY_DN4039_c0_g1_i1.p1 TRINITY_DN4039_c0_g1~~TRINITY_DN4039_c0_g1_i1.p1  ORF type:complete len:1018 (+),score=232.55 TRINITY_DN4039_c0_g1_i1:156-3209(+)